jgi:EAL domain-containing protein (putative c-di-GMP-specific phosphodiesterase class I)/GGDEF domain-containing protein
MTRFRHLRTRLTLLFMGLFGIALMLVAVAVYTAITQSARSLVRDELAASGAVYGQIWAAQSEQLRQGAAVLAQDYGFREAIATNDEPTVRSALDNLRARQQVAGALILGADGHVTSAGIAPDTAAIDALWSGLNSGAIEAGVLTLSGQPYQAVSAPILAPDLIGWVVFLEPLDSAQMRNLEQLSAIPLSASVLTAWAGGWRDMTGPAGSAVDRALQAADTGPGLVRMAGGEAMMLAKPLPSFEGDGAAVLTLSYPMARAMRPYDGMFLALGAIALVGLAILMAGTWLLARGLTRPITDLDEAVKRLTNGEHAEVAVTSSDEIGRLAASFNAMAGDIRDREARLLQMVLHDQETGLPNRLALERDATRSPGAYVLLFGIDRFEVVRNAIGYDSMAQLVSALGSRLAGASGARVARVAAGVLGILLEASDDATALEEATRLSQIADTPVTLIGATVDAALSAGLARSAAEPGDVGSVMDRAAIALDQARATRRKAAVFDAAAYGDPVGNLSLVGDLMSALDTPDTWLAYQPKYDLRGDAITGVEALMRWQHPRRGFVSPDLFITMAEETGQIRVLTEWTVRRAIADQKALAAAGHSLTVSVNISGRLLSDESFADFALTLVASAGADVCFEITETAVIDNPEVALAMIERFSAAGICVSIDDYGSGLSSLAYLKRIRADELKIDKAFILGLDDSSRDALLVKSTIDLAHSLGMTVTAEGVETPTALALLRGMGCDTAQGYLIARPMPLAALIERLEQPALVEAAKAA